MVLNICATHRSKRTINDTYTNNSTILPTYMEAFIQYCFFVHRNSANLNTDVTRNINSLKLDFWFTEVCFIRRFKPGAIHIVLEQFSLLLLFYYRWNFAQNQQYYILTWPVFTKLFRIRIKIRLKLNILSLRTFFETY